MENEKIFAHYGCGLCAPKTWSNFDASPSLRIQRLPFLGQLLARWIGLPKFPPNVRFGNIVHGLPLPPGSCAAIYCSHVLEHLSFEDSLKALKNTYELLEPNGVFRLVVPDLESAARDYLASSDVRACERFMEVTLLGHPKRLRSLSQIIRNHLGNSRHLWMWDNQELNIWNNQKNNSAQGRSHRRLMLSGTVARRRLNGCCWCWQ